VIESLDLGNEYLYSFKGKWIIDTKHSVQRKVERNELEEREIELLFKRSIKELIKRGRSYTEKDGLYLFYSKSLDQAMIIDYREDKKGKSKGRHLIMISYLPKGRSKPRPGTEKIVVERHEESCYIDNQEFVDYFNNLTIVEHEEVELVEGTIEGNYKVKIKDSNEDIIELEVYYCESKMWHLISHELMEID